MQDRYNNRDAFDIVIDWTDSDSGRRFGRRAQRVLGVGSMIAGTCLVIEGLWTHDIENIIGGVAGVATGTFLERYANWQLDDIPNNQI